VTKTFSGVGVELVPGNAMVPPAHPARASAAAVVEARTRAMRENFMRLVYVGNLKELKRKPANQID
jgi:hypothetical protein